MSVEGAIVIRTIEGRHNHSIKLARKLQKKKFRRERGLLIAEGLDLLRIAWDAGVEIGDVLVREDVLTALPAELRSRAEAGATDIGVCSQETLSDSGTLGGSADVVFICGQPQWSLADVQLEQGFSVYLDGVGDPGNVGTLVRSCVGFGANGLICSPGTADPFSPKSMRAGMGAQFLLPVVIEVTRADVDAHMQRAVEAAARRPEVLVADPHDGMDVREIGCTAGLLLVLGSERLGPGEGWQDSRRVTIPQVRFDSLNVAMAGTILLYELSRTTHDGAPPER